MPRSLWSSSSGLSMGYLAAAQAQMEAISAALMPISIAPSGRTQVPAIEIQDREDALVITAFLPGVEPQAVQVRASSRSLTFFGQRQSGYRSPLGYGVSINHFQQTVPLPVAVQDHHMQVAYHQGAIIVTLPKARGLWSAWSAAWKGEELQGWSGLDTLKRQGQRLAQNWQRGKTWLGQRLREWGDRLLTDSY
jgi:HSP20 family protein